MKKFLMALLVLAMISTIAIFGAASMSAATTSGTTGDCTWTLDGTVLTISGNGQMGDYSSTSPTPWGTAITEVIIEDSVTSIGSHAFSSCKNLTNITIGNCVTSVGSLAFFSCSNLTSITIPDGVTQIGSSAFYYCSSLTSITIPDSVTKIDSFAFVGCTSLKSLYIKSPLIAKKLADGTVYGGLAKYAETIYVASEITDISAFITAMSCKTEGVEVDDYTYTKYSSHNYKAEWSNDNEQHWHECTVCGEKKDTANHAYDNAYDITCNVCNHVLTSGTTGDCAWALDGTVLTISGNGKMGEYSSNSPPKWGTAITEVIIEDGVTSIGNFTFDGCSNLTSITIPDSVKSIGEYAFCGCSSLTSINIPNSVASIGDGAFMYCSGLTSITIPNSVTTIGGSAFESCDGLTSITIPDSVTSISDYAFWYCSSLTSVAIGNGVTSIGEFAFESCSSLTSVTIGNGVTSIGDKAFYRCLGLKTLYIKSPHIAETLVDGTMYGGLAKYAETIYVASEITDISEFITAMSHKTEGVEVDDYTYTKYSSHNYKAEWSNDNEQHWHECSICGEKKDAANHVYDNAYDITCNVCNHVLINGTTGDCTWTLKGTVLIISGNGKMNDYYSYGSSKSPWGTAITEVIIEDGVTSIGKYAFYDCSSLTSITIPDSVTSIGDAAFWDCSNITSITVHNNNSSYCSQEGVLFNKDKTKLILYPAGKTATTYVIPNGVTETKERAFAYSSNLTSITIPDSVTSFGSNTFYKCENIKYNEYGKAYYLGNNDNPYLVLVKVKDTSISSIEIHSSTKVIYPDAFEYCSNLTSITIPDGVTSICYGAFWWCTNLTSVTIPDSVTTIGDYAFYCCTSLTSITIPDSVTSIGFCAFWRCPFTSIIIPDSVTSIGSYAFHECSSLTSITIPDSVTEIGDGAFRHCTGLTSVTIGNGVTSIGNYAFLNCTSLTSITIPDSVTEIGDNAFLECTSLKTLYIKSPLIAETLVDGTVYGGLANYAETIYVASEVANISDFITTAVSCKVEGVEVGGDTYTAYSKDHDWIPATQNEPKTCTICGDKGNTQEFAGGRGTEEDPYLIATKEHLNNVRNYLDAHYRLIADIVFTDADFAEGGAYYNGGAGFVPIGSKSSAAFTGSFNGGGYAVKNIYIRISDSSTVYVGLFAENEGVIRNLGMENGEIFGKNTSKNSISYVGGIVGFNAAGGMITDCYNTGNVTADKSYSTSYNAYSRAGGIAGSNNGAITNCYNTGNIKANSAGGITTTNQGTVAYCYNTGSVNSPIVYGSSYGDAGGIVSYNNGVLKCCYNIGTINGGYAGGIAARGKGITECYNRGNVSGVGTYDSYEGGIVSSDGSATNCYYYEGGAKGTGVACTLDQMRNEETFVGFDFTNTWTMAGNEDYLYPELIAVPMEFTKTLTSISISDEPNKSTYLEVKDVLETSGGKITLYYNNDTSEVIDITPNIVSGFDNTKIGNQTLTVTYGGFTDTFEVEIIAKTMTHIGVTTKPSQLAYLEAKDKLDVTGGKITLYYNNDTSEELKLTANMISGFDNTKVGKQTLTVSYKGFTATFEVEIIAKSLSSIGVTTNPSKLNYLEGKDTLDITGGKVTLYYNNDTSEVIVLTADMVSGFDNTQVGKQTLTVSYQGFTNTFEVEIIAKSLTSITVTNKPNKLNYLEAKEMLDVTGGKLTLFYNNDTYTIVDMTDSMISGFNNTIVGKQTLTVRYGDCTAAFDVEIIAKTLISIEITDKPTKLSYLEVKDTLNTTGGKITLYYNNDTSEIIGITSEMVSGFDNTKIGKQTLTVTYKDFTDTFEVEIIAKTMTHIGVTTKPSKLTYLEAKDKLDVTGGKITLYYNNDTSEVVTLTTEMVSGFDNAKVGKQTLSVSYADFTATFDVEIIAKSLSSISVTTKPSNLTYLEGKDKLDVTNGKITLYYNNDTSEIIDITAEMVSGFDNTQVGKQTLTVTYKDFTDTFEVEIIAKTMTHISVTTKPNQLTYLEAKDELNVTGGKITLYYNNGTYKIVDLTADMVSGFDNTKVGKQTLTVSYEGFWDTYNVEIIAKSLTSIKVTTKPNKQIYFTNEQFNKTGMIVTAYYDNGTSEAISDYEIVVSDTDHGTKCITVSHKEKTDSFEVILQYTVVFKDWDGTILSTKNYYFGDQIVVPDNPVKVADNTYTYTFAGWDSAVVNCASDATYTATYTSTYINYTVVFKNWDGTVLSTKTYHYGDAVTEPTTPIKVADNTYTYAFAGWDSAVVSCAGDATYNATYTSTYINYTVVFKNWDGTILSTKTYHYGEAVIEPVAPSKAADNTYTYSFAGWDSVVVNCVGDATYTARFTSTYIDYTVVFEDWNGAIISTKTYHWGEAIITPTNPEKAADNTYTYTFAGWDNASVNCTGDATYTATYTSTYINYTVVFKDWDGTVLSTKTYHYGDAVIAPSAPSKVADNTYTYTFAGWDSAVVNCAGDATYTATYSSIYIEYTIVFKDWDGSIISSNQYHYGDDVVIPESPERSDDTYVYNFTGWDDEVANCTGDVAYTATYEIHCKIGDIDGSEGINKDDAIYILMSTFFPEDYPLNQDCDFDGNGKVDKDDAIYLLMYTFFPDDYPLTNQTTTVYALVPNAKRDEE